MPDKGKKHPKQLSGGQQQRVAIARAIVNRPSFIIADEPTGALDSKTSEEILTLFQQLNNEGVTIILVTHDEETIEYCNRLIKVRDGKDFRGGAEMKRSIIWKTAFRSILKNKRRSLLTMLGLSSGSLRFTIVAIGNGFKEDMVDKLSAEKQKENVKRFLFRPTTLRICLVTKRCLPTMI